MADRVMEYVNDRREGKEKKDLDGYDVTSEKSRMRKSHEKGEV